MDEKVGVRTPFHSNLLRRAGCQSLIYWQMKILENYLDLKGFLVDKRTMGLQLSNLSSIQLEH
jgi:hypothetical protein